MTGSLRNRLSLNPNTERGRSMRTLCLWPIAAVLFAGLSAGRTSGADRPVQRRLDLIDRFEANSRREEAQAGVGIALARRDGQLFVAHVLPGTPAAQVGKLHVADRLIAVGQGNQTPIDVKGMSIGKVVPMIRGVKGTIVVLTIVPAGKADGDAIVIPLTRGTIKEIKDSPFGDGRLIAAGMRAPDLNAFLLPGGGKYQLKNSLGRIVVLEFWASWCGPCLKGLDHLQDLRKQHPEWHDRVQFVCVGIDDDEKNALRCFQERGERWADITVAWAGPSALKSFHIASFPGLYVIDGHGKVITTEVKTDLSGAINKALSAASKAK